MTAVVIESPCHLIPRKRTTKQMHSEKAQYACSKEKFASGIAVNDFSGLPNRRRRRNSQDDLEEASEKFLASRKRRRVSFMKRCVSFNDLVIVHPCPSSIENQPVSVFWETPEDLDEMKANAKALSASIANRAAVNYQHFSYKNVMERIYRHAISKTSLRSTPTREDRNGFYTWINLGHSRRGLERWSIPSVGKHKQIQRSLLVNHVLNVQRAFPDVSTRTLRKVSEVFSIPATLHSLAMGKADEKAAMMEYGIPIDESRRIL